ncbi:MAG: hypothetical protein ABR577_12785 [Pyrinomonadaceae bacterium]
MPRVAVTAAVLLVARLLLRDTFLFGENTLDITLELLSSLAILLTVFYYGVKGFRYAERRLLWRVRRRLIITYLFIGLTPIVLLASLGFIAALIGAGQAMSRLVAVETATTEKQSLASARALSEAFQQVPPEASDRAVKSWLDARTLELQTSLPGARIALWRANERGGAPQRTSLATRD